MTKLIWIVAAANGLAALVLGAVRQNLPSVAFWMDKGGWIWVALGVTFAVPLIQAAVIDIGERRRRTSVEREQKVQAFLIASLIYVVEQGGAPWKNTGIQAFAVRGFWRWKKQHRVAKFRMGAIPTSGVKWSKGRA